MRTVRDGVFGAIGRRRRTGQCVLGGRECGGQCIGSESRSTRGTGAGDPTRAMAGSPLGAALAEAARCFLALGTGAVPLHRGARDARALGLRPERPAHFAFGEKVKDNYYYPLPFLCSPFLLVRRSAIGLLNKHATKEFYSGNNLRTEHWPRDWRALAHTGTPREPPKRLPRGRRGT